MKTVGQSVEHLSCAYTNVISIYDEEKEWEAGVHDHNYYLIGITDCWDNS